MKTEQFIEMLEQGLAKDLSKRIEQSESGSIIWNGLNVTIQTHEKKDIWEGIEFIRNKTTGECFKVSTYLGKHSLFLMYRRIQTMMMNNVHITQEEYVEYIKKEFVKKFFVGTNTIKVKDFNGFKKHFILGSTIKQPIDINSDHFEYDKDRDELRVENFTFYREGKWVKIVKKQDSDPFIEKDPWEGVEFVEYLGDGSDVRKGFTKGKIYKVREFKDYVENLGVVIDDNESTTNGYAHKFFKPSTEQAYIEQKKAEVFKRFGEIKIGQKFEAEWINEKDSTDNFCKESDPNKWIYRKSSDRLFLTNEKLFGGAPIYCQGKWATRVKKAKVFLENYKGSPTNGPLYFIEVKFGIEDGPEKLDLNSISEFLTQQFEKNINKELK